MPIYEYQCQVCDQQFEKFFRSIGQVSDEVLCPACNSPAVQRLISAPVVQSGPAAGGEARDVAAAAESSAAGQTPVFGRKELNQALEQKRQMKEQAKYEAKQANKQKK